ncbi:coiled-coil domain-containing protein-domain-containing protein [Phycomyces nitens]|nr:coiled-coil domain-containing protein-domain-containing protein [Phycomyces nitens]
MNQTNRDSVLEYAKNNLDEIEFKTLKRDETELNDQEKLKQMEILLERDPGLFLSKWGKYLPDNILSQFESLRGDYEIDFYLRNMLHDSPQNSPASTPVLTTKPYQPSRYVRNRVRANARNRRFVYLQSVLRNSEYFSDESLQLRDPVLYEYFIGKYTPASKRTEPFASDVKLVERVLSDIDRDYVEQQLKLSREREQEQFEEEEEEEEEEDDEDEEEDEKDTKVDLKMKGKATDVHVPDRECLMDTSDDESMKDDSLNTHGQDLMDDTEEGVASREDQRKEFVRIMEERFLIGNDTDFDYSAVDYNEAYDDLDQQERDAHDRYFDDEESQDPTPTQKETEYTGELDY